MDGSSMNPPPSPPSPVNNANLAAILQQWHQTFAEYSRANHEDHETVFKGQRELQKEFHKWDKELREMIHGLELTLKGVQVTQQLSGKQKASVIGTGGLAGLIVAVVGWLLQNWPD